MSSAQFSLVKKVPVDILRHAQDTYVNGRLVVGAVTTVTVQANVHPFSDYQLMLLPDAERSKSWVWMFTSCEVRQKKEGSWGADQFYWDGDLYEVMKSQHYVMQTRSHFEAKAVRKELTPN